MPDDEFALFQRQVKEARPDIHFTFQNLNTSSNSNYIGRWTFPGARTGEYAGGLVGWDYGTHKLWWGIDHKDVAAWVEFEKANGREPRFT